MKTTETINTGEIYFGEQEEFYHPEIFDNFAVSRIPSKLRSMNISGKCDVERHGGNSIVYHFIDAGFEIRYAIENKQECRIAVNGSRQEIVDNISRYILEEGKRGI